MSSRLLDDLRARIPRAAERVAPRVRRTPIVPSERLSGLAGCEVLLKLESLQTTGSFKLRGALARLLALDPLPERVVAASTGNHGAAVAEAARSVGARARVFAPRGADEEKLARVERLGAEVVRVEGVDCVDAEVAARAEAEERGVPYVSPYNDLDVISGAAGVGLEIVADTAPCDLVAVAVGGGGLIAGVAAGLEAWPEARVLGCSPERSATMMRSVEAGRIVADEGLATLSDATAGGLEEGALTLALCRELVDAWVTVPEERIAAEMRSTLLEDRVVAEGAAAVATAGLVAAVQSAPERPRRALAVVCGGNVSAATLAGVLA